MKVCFEALILLPAAYQQMYLNYSLLILRPRTCLMFSVPAAPWQDLALYNEFTIGNTLTFFGRIHGLTSKETQARMDFLIDFLDLPQKSSLVRNLR